MLELVPISLKEANAYVERYHRHHKPVVGHKFSIAAAVDGEIVGVAIVGRPVSRYLDDGWTLEVNRLCTNGYRNACSFLYSAAWRAARNLGYKNIYFRIRKWYKPKGCWLEVCRKSGWGTLDGKKKTRSRPLPGTV